MLLLLIAVGAFVATFLGGLFALKLKDKLHLVLGFSAGAVIGVAFFDLLPEALELGGTAYSTSTIVTVVAIGFAIYLLLDRMFLLHSHDHGDDHDHSHEDSTRRGILGAASLSLHSFLDGIGIGLAFKVSPEVGLVVAFAVLAHDFSDGINTVNMILKNEGERRRAFKWLLVDAFAPILGIVTTLFITVRGDQLGLLLALFAGFFLYIGASDLLPESHHAHPVRWTTISSILGMAVLYAVIQLAGI